MAEALSVDPSSEVGTTVDFILAVQTQERLYNPNHPFYGQTNEETWRSLAEDLKWTEIQCRRKWRSLRSQYCREMWRLKQKGSKISEWCYFDLLEFLQPYLSCCEHDPSFEKFEEFVMDPNFVYDEYTYFFVTMAATVRNAKIPWRQFLALQKSVLDTLGKELGLDLVEGVEQGLRQDMAQGLGYGLGQRLKPGSRPALGSGPGQASGSGSGQASGSGSGQASGSGSGQASGSGSGSGQASGSGSGLGPGPSK